MPSVGSTYCNSLDDDTLTLYFVTHLSEIATISFVTNADDGANAQIVTKSIEDRDLQRKLKLLRENYDRRENLGGFSIMKSWGLASMPKEGLVTACISVHPGDMPEYIIPSVEKSTLLFASDTSEDRRDAFPWQNTPAVWDVDDTQKTILDAIIEYAKTSNRLSSDLSVHINDAATAALHRFLHEDDEDRTVTSNETCAICESTILFENLTEASCLRGHQCGELTIFNKALNLKRANEQKVLHTTQWFLFALLPYAILICMVSNQAIVRCALTFLAITSPGISKRCELCGREFLNEHVVTVEEDRVFGAHQPSLACWLFRKFDSCPYCGGKYIG